MAEATSEPRPKTTPFNPFSYGRRQRDLAEAVTERVRKSTHERHSRMIDSRNMFSYRHGREWAVDHSSDEPEFSKFVRASADAQIHYRDIVDHKLSVVSEYIQKMCDDFQGIFTKNIFQLVDQTTQATGNITNFSGNIAQDFLESLRKIEVGVDRYGRPTMPTLFVHPEQRPRIITELESQPETFQREIEKLKHRKEIEATICEAKRISKFRW